MSSLRNFPRSNRRSRRAPWRPLQVVVVPRTSLRSSDRRNLWNAAGAAGVLSSLFFVFVTQYPPALIIDPRLTPPAQLLSLPGVGPAAAAEIFNDRRAGEGAGGTLWEEIPLRAMPFVKHSFLLEAGGSTIAGEEKRKGPERQTGHRLRGKAGESPARGFDSVLHQRADLAGPKDQADYDN